MNPLPQTDVGTSSLLDIIELKWLLAGRGVHVHVERLELDREYARSLLDRAGAAGDRVLHDLALRLRTRLQVDAAPDRGDDAQASRR